MDEITVQRKLMKIGNSCGATFPHEVLKHLNVKPGDQIDFKIQTDGTVTLNKKESTTLPKGVDPDFINMVNGIIDKYDDVFKGLTTR
jgi:putative addiction module antidote